MPSTTDAANVLATKLVQTLQAQRSRGSTAYPLTLQRLAELTDATASSKLVLAAVLPQRKAFSQHAVVARKDLQAPVALLEDLSQLATSRMLLEFLLEKTRTPTNQAASAAELKKKAARKLQKPFQEALDRQIAEGMLPPTVGWVLIKKARKLFLLTDLHTGRSELASGERKPPELRSPQGDHAPRLPETRDGASDFARAFEEAFARLDRQAGLPNFVSLVDLRQALPWDRPTFDAELRKLRLAGRYGLSAAEGRHGITPEEQRAGIREEGALLLFVSRK
jgi:hypothetical protein